MERQGAIVPVRMYSGGVSFCYGSFCLGEHSFGALGYGVRKLLSRHNGARSSLLEYL
jgi:hypothetical protein